MSDPLDDTGLPDPRVKRLRPSAGYGEPVVFVADEQADHALDGPRYGRLAEEVLAARGVQGHVEVSLLFVDTLTIADLNRRFMGSDGPTDVLAFPIDEDAAESGRWPDGSPAGPDRLPPDVDDQPLLLGDLVLCPSVAAANAPTHAGTLADELALLVVHGLLHLLGFDHADDDERATMQRAERELLDQLWGPLAADPWAAP